MKRKVLITGVSRKMGLGFETAKQLTHLNYEVIITARKLEKVKALAEEIGASAMKVDIIDDGSIQQLQQQIEAEYGHLDVLINNAGAFFDAGKEPMSSEMDFVQKALNTNLMGAWRMIKAFHPLLSKSDHAVIVNVSSGAGSFGDPIFGLPVHPSNVPVYGITKLALNGLTVKMARQFEGSNIKVNSVCPGFVATYPGTEEWGARPVSEGAKGIVWAATIGKDGPHGGFFRDGKALSW
ncbi:MAG: SDR family NAD(P)-dependent oxidoreductase [Bacteroidota bacterium]